MPPVEMLGQAPLASDRLARPLSPATRAGDFVFVSGQVPTDDQGQVILRTGCGSSSGFWSNTS